MAQVYYDGNWYYSYAATTAGQSPDTNPALWVLLPIPSEFGEALEPLAAGIVLQGQQRGDQSLALMAEGRSQLEEMKRHEVFRSRRPRPLRVVDRDS